MQSDSPISPTPDPEVPAKATRRRFTAAEKARILDAYDAASDIEKAAICRREKVYSTLLSNWRVQRRAGKPLEAKPGRKPGVPSDKLAQLEKRNVELEERLRKAEQVIDVQGKVYALLRACAGESADHLALPPWQKS